MKLCVVTNVYPPEVHGGYELLAEDVVHSLRERQHHVEVLCSGDGSAKDGVHRTLSLAVPFGRPAGRERLRHTLLAPWNGRAVGGYLGARPRPDVVLAMSQRRLGLEPLRVFGRAGVPVVATVNDDWPLAYGSRNGESLRARASTLFDKTVFRRGTWADVPIARVVCVSRAMESMLLGAGLPLPRPRVQAQGVDARHFWSRSHRPMVQPLRLLWVGRLHPQKSPEIAFDAVAELARRGVSALLEVVGGAVDDAYAASLRRSVAARGITERVRWRGFVGRDHLPEVYRASDVFLFTSVDEGEGQGLTYLEAMASGVPVVAYPAGGARDLLEGRGVAELAAAPDGRAFADAIAALAASDERVRTRVAAGAELLRTEASLERYVDVLESELMAATRARA